MTDGDTMTVTYTGVDAVRWRIIFEPRSAGGYNRIEYRETSDGWEPVGNEIVSDVEVDRGAELIA